MSPFLLCLALLAEPTTIDKIDQRGCNLAELLVSVAQEHELHPALLVAVAKIETGIRPGLVSPGGHCGLLQTHPDFAKTSCKALHRPRVGARAGARLLEAFARRCRGDLRCTLRRYSGSRPGNYVYADEVLVLAQSLDDQMRLLDDKKGSEALCLCFTQNWRVRNLDVTFDIPSKGRQGTPPLHPQSARATTGPSLYHFGEASSLC